MFKKQRKALEAIRRRLSGDSTGGALTARGKDIKVAMNIPKDRMLVRKPAGADDVQRVRDDEVIDLEPMDEFDDLPVGRWG